jgi:hypothetical protein
MLVPGEFSGSVHICGQRCERALQNNTFTHAHFRGGGRHTGQVFRHFHWFHKRPNFWTIIVVSRESLGEPSVGSV